MRNATLILVALSVALIGVACSDDDTPVFIPDAGTDSTTEQVFILPDDAGAESGISATLLDAAGNSVASIDEEHGFGINDCPQLLGTFMVENTSAEEVSATLMLADPNVAIAITPAELTVAAGSSATFTIEFTCASTADFATTMALEMMSASYSGTFTIDLALDVVGAP